MSRVSPTVAGTAKNLCVLGLAFCLSPCRAETFWIRAEQGRSSVMARSRTQLDSFASRTQKVTGRIQVNPADLDQQPSGHIEVDLGSLDTGIERRNRHMRDNVLETAKYPTAGEEAKSTLPGDLLTITGNFVIKLSDYNIEPPRFLLLKVADEQTILLRLTASTMPGPE